MAVNCYCIACNVVVQFFSQMAHITLLEGLMTAYINSTLTPEKVVPAVRLLIATVTSTVALVLMTTTATPTISKNYYVKHFFNQVFWI